MSTIQLWHSENSRSLRILWALEEMSLDYELHCLPFPPRVFAKDYLKVNKAGTVPYFVDGSVAMNESVAVCQYLASTYGREEFDIPVSHAEYGSYLNWLFYSESTLILPLVIYARDSRFLARKKLPSDDRMIARDQCRLWYESVLSTLADALKENDFLCDNRFTIADLVVCYSLYLGDYMGFASSVPTHVGCYFDEVTHRPAFERALQRTDGLTLKSIL